MDIEKIVKVVKICVASDLNNATLLFKGLSVFGVVPPAVPALLESAKNALLPEEKEPCKMKEMLDTLQQLKDEHPELYKQMVDKLSNKN